MTYFNSNSSRGAGVGIAMKLTSDIQVLDSDRDTADRMLILKTMTGNRLLTLVAFYDTNENKECHLNGIKTLHRKIGSNQGIIIGSDWNNFTDRILDQRGNQGRPQCRTKATKIHQDWHNEHKFMDIYRINNPDGKELTYLKSEETNRTQKDKGSRLDKFLISEDLCMKEMEFKHTQDYFYTEEFGMEGNSIVHGSLRMIFK